MLLHLYCTHADPWRVGGKFHVGGVGGAIFHNGDAVGGSVAAYLIYPSDLSCLSVSFRLIRSK
jgi:hypothetical protein